MGNQVVVATQEGIVDFGRFPDSALQEVAVKQAVNSADSTVIIAMLRTRLMLANGTALRMILWDYRMRC